MCWPFHVVLTPVVFALLVVATLVVGVKVLLIFGRVLSGSLADADGEEPEDDDDIHTVGQLDDASLQERFEVYRLTHADGWEAMVVSLKLGVAAAEMTRRGISSGTTSAARRAPRKR